MPSWSNVRADFPILHQQVHGKSLVYLDNGATGLGVLYGRRTLLEKLAPDETGGGMVVNVTYEGATWKPTPERFEAGTPNVADAIALGVACDYLDALGRMFERVLPVVITLPSVTRDALFARLELTGNTGRDFGYGVGDSMNYLLSKYADDDGGEVDK